MWKLRNSVALLRPGEARFPLHSYEATRFAYSSILHVSGQISERACNLLLPAVLLDLGGIKTSSTKKKIARSIPTVAVGKVKLRRQQFISVCNSLTLPFIKNAESLMQLFVGLFVHKSFKK